MNFMEEETFLVMDHIFCRDEFHSFIEKDGSQIPEVEERKLM